MSNMNSFLMDNISTGKRARPPRILLYGIEGIGKSTFASNFPAPVFVPTEDGLDNIDCSRFPLANCYEDVIQDLEALFQEEHEFNTVVIDSLDWLERAIWKKVCLENKVEAIEKIDWGKGYNFALTYWQELIYKLEALRDRKRMMVLMLAHAVTEDYKDAEVSIKRFTPRLHKSARSLIAEYCDVILLATRKLGAARGEDSERIIRTESSAKQLAKSRYPMPAVLPLDASAVLGAIQNSFQSKPF